MTNCLRDFILSINNIKPGFYRDPEKERMDRYLKQLKKKWKAGNNERHQYEETFLKIISGKYVS